MSIAFLLTGDPTWVIAAANLTYLIGICLPSIAVWLLRRNEPARERPYRAPRGTIVLGVIAAGAWGIATVLGFEQFGLPTVLAGIGLAYSGSVLYAYRVWRDRRRTGERGSMRSLHVKLTGAMLLVLLLDGVGYLLAVTRVDAHQHVLVTALEDIFVAVALLTISVGLVLPGMISHAIGQVARAADRLATGTLADLTRAMEALANGNLDAAQARVTVEPVVVYTKDEVGAMAASFNFMQEEAAGVAASLEGARRGLSEAREGLEQMAFNDALTGLANRGMFQRILELELARAARTGGGVAVLYVDLDDFKLVNDSFGHSLGDDLLRDVARRLELVTRDHDTVARTGGDEFLVVLGGFDPGRASDVESVIAFAEDMAERIRRTLQEPFELAGSEVRVSACTGASIYPIDADDVENLLKHADIAMYEAKRRGRGSYHVYARGADEARTLLTTTTDLHHAIERGEFCLHYQPVVDLASGDFAAVEGLIRWQRPGHGLILPDAFLPIAERAGLIGDLSAWVARETCRQARDWQIAGIDLRVGFNLPPVLWQPAVLRDVVRLLDEYDLRGDRLAIEITESELGTELFETSPVLDELRRRGVSIAIDDFGTGHSSLSRLTKVPATTLKIDRAFVREIPGDKEAATLVSTIIQLANNLGLSPLAEGVETETQRAFLIDHGCRLGQGFLFSRPVPAEEVEALYRKRRNLRVIA
jgi:diguanylate cyclase (GGDEF)-like protein